MFKRQYQRESSGSEIRDHCLSGGTIRHRHGEVDIACKPWLDTNRDGEAANQRPWSGALIERRTNPPHGIQQVSRLW